MRLHLISLPHTQTTSKYLICAYTQKVVKFCKMMTARGYEVILYSGEENEAICTKHVPLVTERWRRSHYGKWDPDGLFSNIDWNPTLQPWKTFNSRAIAEIRKRADDRDLLCFTMGGSQYPISTALPVLTPVEWAVGYEGVLSKNRIFESYAWMHHVYGLRQIKDGFSYDTVIPNFFDPADFQVADKRDDYLLFMGRLVYRKGPHIAAQLAQRAGMRLIVAGPGGKAIGRNIQGDGVLIEGAEYVGPVNTTERAELMARAQAVIVPTQYIEPFGGVAVEAMCSGTPVVTTNWGAFTETVDQGITGYRFHVMAEAVAAVEKCKVLNQDGLSIRQHALSRFGLEPVGQLFDDHFQRLDGLWGVGYYA